MDAKKHKQLQDDIKSLCCTAMCSLHVIKTTDRGLKQANTQQFVGTNTNALSLSFLRLRCEPSALTGNKT